VSEIKTKSDPETEWFWIPGEQNIADMGTRPTVMLKDMGPGTPYQEGLPWMRELPEAWRTKKTFTPPPPEECKKDMLAIVKAARTPSGLWYPPRADTRAKLERVYGYVYTFQSRARKHSDFTPVPVRISGTGKETVRTYGPPVEPYREAARLLLLQDAQTSIRKGRLEGLMAETRMYDGVRGEADHHIGRSAEEVSAGGIRQGRLTYRPSLPPPVQVVLGRGLQDGSRGSRRDGHEK
jgi:hypothetical protein